MKVVRFGPHVVDNENKTRASRSGLPNDCPGKFPSPWTPKVVRYAENKDQPEATSDRTATEVKPTVSLRKNDSSQANDLSQPHKPRAKDDADLTIDFLDPRSESGRYWKEQYLLYSSKSEEEVKKLIAKTKLAKDYAKKMDDEASELRQRLVTERKRHQSREKALEKQIKDLQEQLRRLLAENGRATTKPALVQQRVEGQHHHLRRDSWKTVPETQQMALEADSRWSEVVGAECDTSYIPKSARSNSTRANTRPQQTRSTEEPREKSTNQPSGMQRRSDSVVDRKCEQSTNTANFVKTVPPLAPRSPNIAVRLSPRIKTKFVADRVARQSGEVCDAPNIDSKFGSSAPSEALAIQTDQPIVPAPTQKQDHHQRNATKDPGLPANRATAAADRIAARKKSRGLQKENKQKLVSTVI